MLYWKIMMNAIQSNTTYRFNTFVTTLYKILHILVHVSVWTALYSSNKIVTGEAMATLEDMVTYVVISTVISIFVENGNIWSLSSRVDSGEISMLLIKPINFFRQLLFHTLGDKVFAFLFEILPVMLIGLFIFNIGTPNLMYLGLFLISVFISFFIFFLITFLIGLLSFWYVKIFHLSFILNNTMKFFSGSWIPLWLFPDSLLTVAKFLPFELIYYSPIRIYLEQVSTMDIYGIFAKGIVWCMILGVLNYAVWKIGFKQLVIQGG
ncbi:ABC transporter permease [Paenibacillus sp. NPDC057967]|uniref:ABC transporter permease n=1 Tax=Paenibacillus sp. NPDC057967 TaxID=3346293 RepID=UPI0036DEF745